MVKIHPPKPPRISVDYHGVTTAIYLRQHGPSHLSRSHRSQRGGALTRAVAARSGRRQPDPLRDLGRALQRYAAPLLAILQPPRQRPVRAPADALPHVCTRIIAES